MNPDLRKSIFQHIIIIAVFLILSLVFFAPIMSGKVLVQGDIMQWKGMAKEILDHKEETGDQALWTNRPFAGMPSFLIHTAHPSNILRYLDSAISLGLNGNFRPVKMLFLLFLGFYLCCLLFGLNKWASAIGASAFALSTFLIVSLEAGHNTKIWATAYMPVVIASILYAYRKNALLGAIALAITLGLNLNANHVQITYYTFLTAVIIFLYELVFAGKEGRFASFAKTTAILAAAAILAVGLNAGRLMTTYYHSQETIRGGSSELSVKKAKDTGGLDYDYAMSWSYGKMESFTFLIPNFAGGASAGPLSESSNVYEELVAKGVPKSQARQTIKQLPLYYGEQPITAGPTYFGAIICLLFVFALIILPWKHKTWVIAATLFALLLGWGKHFFLAGLFFDYFPLFNKFRTPAMILTILCFLFPLMAVFSMDWLLKNKENKSSWLMPLLIATGVTGGFCVFTLLFGSAFWSFEGIRDGALPEWLIEPLINDRISMLKMDAFRSLAFILLAAALVFLYIKDVLKGWMMMAGLALLILVDLGSVAKRYVTADDFEKAKSVERTFRIGKAEADLRKDKGVYRIWNTGRRLDQDGITPYYFNSLSGYSAAKLVRYQDLIDLQLSKGNTKVLNMLNTKYVIQNDEAQVNPGACGPVWIANSIKWAKDADQEMSLLDSFSPCDEVIINESYKSSLGNFSPTGQGSIRLTENDMDEIRYEANVSGEQLAVFSEIYYDAGNGWKAWINDEPAEVLQVNYTLRGLKIPSGRSNIRFEFSPSFYKNGERISMVSSILLLLLVGALIYQWYKGGGIKAMSQEEKEPQENINN